MNKNRRIGLVGLVATAIPNQILRTALPAIFPVFTGSWWYMWFPLYCLWTGFLVIGLVSRGSARDGDDGAGEK